jgi:cyclohexyl-isocyanide hydratase
MSDFDVGFVIFPGITQLDFTGPFEVLSRLNTPPSVSVASKFSDSRTHVIAKTLQPVSSDRGLSFLPTCTFDSAPSLNLICVPGGVGIVDVLANVETVDFVRDQSGRAQFVTSVCTGAFLLGAAGLLKGRRATTHWAYADLLPLVGATHEKARIVRDGNVFTAGGVTSGIDFAFRIVTEIAGPEVAQAIQLAVEYDPSPPFDMGRPEKASKEAMALMRQRNEKTRAGLVERFGKLTGDGRSEI